MSTPNIPLRLLDSVQVASPCSMNWDDMQGDDRVRHCSQCNLNVFNLSGMSDEQAEAVLRGGAGTEGRLCIRLYRRADGTVLTRDCLIGLRAARQRLARTCLRAVAILAFILTGGFLTRTGPGNLAATGGFARLSDRLRPYLPGAPQPLSNPRFWQQPPRWETGERVVRPIDRPHSS